MSDSFIVEKLKKLLIIRSIRSSRWRSCSGVGHKSLEFDIASSRSSRRFLVTARLASYSP